MGHSKFISVIVLGAFFLSSKVESLSFYSQAGQDSFVYTLLYELLGKEDSGVYLEIGAGEPIDINNSYYFEKNLGWNGISIDISPNLADRWHAARSNRLLSADATRTNYSNLLNTFPRLIDYLSLDVDGYYDMILERLPFDEHQFKIITIEHDFYRYGDLYREKERQILQRQGYYLLCADVKNGGLSFEDWWILPNAFPEPIYSVLKTLDLKERNGAEIAETIRAAFD